MHGRTDTSTHTDADTNTPTPTFVGKECETGAKREKTRTNENCHRAFIAVYIHIVTIAYTYGLFTGLVHTGLAPVVVRALPLFWNFLIAI